MPNLIQNITVRDAGTHATLAGAQVFVNGVGKGATDSNGQINVSMVAIAYQLTVKLNNYNTFTAEVPPASSFIANLDFSTPSINTSFALNVVPEDKADGMIITFSNAGNAISQIYNSGGITITGLTSSSQTIVGEQDGFEPITQQFDLSVSSSGTIVLVVSDDSGLKVASNQVPAEDPDVNSILPVITVEDLPEFVAPNTGQGTYFTMSQARMYIGGLFINELNSLQWALQDNKIPIYGYASRFLDAKAQGKSLVQGQFTINFISEGYLLVALQNYQTQVIQSTTPINPQVAQNQARLLKLVNQLQNPDPAWTPTQISNAKSEINSLAASLGPDAVTAARGGINTIRRQQNNNLLGLPGGDYPNAVYSDIEFDIVVEYEGAGRTIIRRLERCSLISNETIHDHSGAPIVDSYGFIARRLR